MKKYLIILLLSFFVFVPKSYAWEATNSVSGGDTLNANFTLFNSDVIAAQAAGQAQDPPCAITQWIPAVNLLALNYGDPTQSYNTNTYSPDYGNETGRKPFVDGLTWNLVITADNNFTPPEVNAISEYVSFSDDTDSCEVNIPVSNQNDPNFNPPPDDNSYLNSLPLTATVISNVITPSTLSYDSAAFMGNTDVLNQADSTITGIGAGIVAKFLTALLIGGGILVSIIAVYFVIRHLKRFIRGGHRR